MEVITHKKIMKEWTSLIYLFCICGLISSINGQQFPVFGQGQQVQGQGNPAQFQQFLQTRQAAPGVGGGTAAGGTATGLTNSVRTVTVPILPAPPGTDLTQGTTFTQFQRGATQTASPDGPIPRFTQGSAFLGRPFTQFGPNMRPIAQGQQMNAASMAAAQQRQAQMQQNAQQLQARQQAGMAAQQAGMAASRTQFPGLGLAMQRRMAQQQFMAQRQNGNAFMTGLAQRQQAARQNQQGQQGAGTLWRPDVRMPGMMTPPGGAFPPRRFPGMFPPGFVNRNIARQNGAATGITGASNALNAPRAQQTQNRLTPPIMNPRDPRLGLMPVQANLQMFGSRQRPFPTPNVAATQRAMNRQNRMNTNSMAAAATNRINPNFPPVNSQFPGAVGRRTMPVNVGTPQGMARGPMPPNFGAFQGSGGRAMPSSVGAFPGSGGGAAPSNVGAFPGGQTNADMSANQIVPSNVDMFPGIGSSSSTDGSTVTNELPGEISAFPGAESSSGSSASAATEFIGDIPAFPGAESIGASSMTSDLPVFPAGDSNIGLANSDVIFPNVGEEPGLTAGEIPPPPPVFPAKDINNIPASADAELFPPFDLGRGSTGSPFSENIPPVPAGEMMGSPQDFGRVNSASTLEVSMIEPNSRTGIKPAASSFPGVNSADVTPPKTGNMVAPVMTEPTEAPTFSEFPSANFESSFPGSGTSSFGGASSSSFPGAGTDVASSFPGMGNAVESQKSSVSISGSEVPFVASGFPGSETRSEVNSFPGSDFISAPSANQATETPSGMASFPGSGSNMSGFPGMRTEKTSTFSPSKGVAPPGTVSGIEGFERTESDLSSSIGGVPIELWQR
ncbi:Hypothetical predicted protein [Mytilus galloprovincialis]|uniref:Uncharacterized protein n=1 Tax=Mytilus galloprovincialis TaxID=29158 RepID=A0A8B6H8T2_MYTGA|nr:Hypothetical predicted protein [Mytilus galloprovincialis]